MSKRREDRKKGHKKSKEKHPTIFAFDGSIRYYEDGTLSELHKQVTDEEWEMIVQETISYKIFLKCLKEIAFPKLQEKWGETEEWFRIQMGVATSRIRSIDPLLAATHKEDIIEKAYRAKMETGAEEAIKYIQAVKEKQMDLIKKNVEDDKTARVSNL